MNGVEKSSRDGIEALPIFRPAAGEEGDDLLRVVYKYHRELESFGAWRLDPPPSWMRPQINLHETRDSNIKLTATLQSSEVQDTTAARKKRMRIPVRDFRIMDMVRRNGLAEATWGRSTLSPPLPTDQDFEDLFFKRRASGEGHGALDDAWSADEPAKKHIVDAGEADQNPPGLWHCGNITTHPRSVLACIQAPDVEKQKRLQFSQTFCRSPWTRAEDGTNRLVFNYFGSYKVVYVIPPSEVAAFERFCEERGFRVDSTSASNLVPAALVGHGFAGIRKALLRPQSYLVVAGKSLISTLDLGFNVSESSSFATLAWFHDVPEELRHVLPVQCIMHRAIVMLTRDRDGTLSKMSAALLAETTRVFREHEEFLELGKRSRVSNVLLESAPKALREQAKSAARSKDRKAVQLEGCGPRCCKCTTECQYSFLARAAGRDYANFEFLCAGHSQKILKPSTNDAVADVNGNGDGNVVAEAVVDADTLANTFLVRRHKQIFLSSLLKEAFGTKGAALVVTRFDDEGVAEPEPDADPGHHEEQRSNGRLRYGLGARRERESDTASAETGLEDPDRARKAPRKAANGDGPANESTKPIKPPSKTQEDAKNKFRQLMERKKQAKR